jgi:hypothetical protein
MPNWTANDILLQNRKTSRRHRSDRLTWSNDYSRFGRCSAGMKLLFRSSIVPPEIFLQ